MRSLRSHYLSGRWPVVRKSIPKDRYDKLEKWENLTKPFTTMVALSIDEMAESDNFAFATAFGELMRVLEKSNAGSQAIEALADIEETLDKVDPKKVKRQLIVPSDAIEALFNAFVKSHPEGYYAAIYEAPNSEDLVGLSKEALEVFEPMASEIWFGKDRAPVLSIARGTEPSMESRIERR